MSYKFDDSLLLRMPVKSWTGYRETAIATLLKEPFFLAAIYIASPGFYNRLLRAGFDTNKLNTRECNTLKKYHNRICFRPTPFGLFSAVSLVKWGAENVLKISGGEQDLKPCINPDQSFVMALARDLLDDETCHIGTYVSNPILYRAGKEYRFLRTDVDEAYKKRDYDLQSTDYSPLLKNLLSYCAEGKSRDELVQYIIDNTGCEFEDAQGYFQFMADSQLLRNTLQPNIVGQDYLQRLLLQLKNANPNNKKLGNIKTTLKALNNNHPITPDFFIDLNHQLKSLLPEHLAFGQDKQLSVILQNKSVGGTISTDYQQAIADAIFAADKLLPQEPPKALKEFAKAFKKQFDQQSIPLLKILDPEIGLGYQAPDTAAKNPMLETLNVHKKDMENAMKWTPAHRYLLGCWHSNNNEGAPIIQLQKEQLLKLKPDEDDIQLLGTSALFRVVNGQVIIDTLGGTNAPALAGRFTVADTEIARAARQMAIEMEAANPDITFAEILHLSDPHIDNINRRERIWTKELPLTAHSLVIYDDQVQLGDLYVSVENDTVVLRLAKDRKMVIPRLSSAYNYSRNKLPLFYFLADISYQFGKTNFTLDMAQFFPGLSFYPRVEYQATILYLATWILNKEQIALLDNDNEEMVISGFNQVANEIKLPDVFSLTQADQQLVFYRDRQQDILLLAELVKGKNEAVLKEYLQDNVNISLLKDLQNNGYVTQFNAFLYSTNQLKFLPKPVQLKTNNAQRHYVLGSEWLYLKIYLPKLGIGGLLLKVSPLLKRIYPHGAVKKWFFIRYDDHAPHMRLRLKIDPEDLSVVLKAFKQKLEKSIYQHIVREYQADTYSREIERYQAANYDLTEDYFWRSSEFVLGFLKAERRDPERALPHIFALYTIRDLLVIFLPDKQDQLRFVQINYQQFMLEFDDKKIAFELDKKYRELSKQINTELRDADFYAKLNLKTAATKFIQSVRILAHTVQTQQAADKSFLAAIIHMHLNRVFVDDARKQEMMVYYFLYKYLISNMARKK
jgi:thiopeptide-type bacteriocin biosynthesis protein